VFGCFNEIAHVLDDPVDKMVQVVCSCSLVWTSTPFYLGLHNRKHKD
jgi:hypothetical protein